MKPEIHADEIGSLCRKKGKIMQINSEKCRFFIKEDTSL